MLAAYGGDYVDKLGLRQKVPQGWFTRHAARKLFEKTPLVRQLRGESAKLGKRRSGTVPEALERADKGFRTLSQWASGGGAGSDEPLNHALGAALRQTLDVGSDKVIVEQPHPWLTSIVPDIRVDVDPTRHICIEMSYTNKDEPYVVADYVLRKLDRYMKQLELKLKGTGLDLA